MRILKSEKFSPTSLEIVFSSNMLSQNSKFRNDEFTPCFIQARNIVFLDESLS